MTMSRALATAFTVLSALLLVGEAGAQGDVEAGARKAGPCAACHGPGGNSVIPGTPSLAAQPAWFTHWALIKLRDGRRKDPVMAPLAAPLSDQDMADFSAYYAGQAPAPRPQPVDAKKATAGKTLWVTHNCTHCHRPDLAGQNQVPRVAGQDLTYLLKMLRAYRAQTAGDLEGLMTQAAQPLSDADIESLAHYMAGFQ